MEFSVGWAVLEFEFSESEGSGIGTSGASESEVGVVEEFETNRANSFERGCLVVEGD